jgi:hypothetical protein
MKQMIALAVIALLLIPGVAAAAPGNGNAAIGAQNQQGDGAGDVALEFQQQERDRARNVTEIHASIQERQRILDQQVENASPAEQAVLRNQNQVRLAVHALLAAENRTGGIGENVSAIAREFNNSVMRTIRAEEQIQERSGMVRFLFGGNMTAARILEEETVRNRERAQELTMLIANCTCDDETRTLLQEQVRTMAQEQNRLSEVSRHEREDRGIFGWFWK